MVTRGGNGAPGPEVAARIEEARKFLLAHLDTDNQWVGAQDAVRARWTDLGSSSVLTAVLQATLELEREGLLVFGADDKYHDPATYPVIEEAPLDVVAAAIEGLPWPDTRRENGARTINEMFLDLAGRYRHCDVYAACHQILKPSGRLTNRRTPEARHDQRYWWWHGEPVAAQPVTPATDRLPGEERQLERDLEDAYIEWLGYRLRRQRHVGNRFIDLWDSTRRLLIESKASAADEYVWSAMGQAMFYRVLLADADADAVIAVLLPAEPTEEMARCLRQYSVGVIYRTTGGDFVEHLELA